ATASLRDVTTQDTYALYCSAHWTPHFKTIDGVTDAAIEEYTSARLGKVKSKTVNKELGALRALMVWAEGRGLCEPVTIRGVSKRTPGVAHPKGKRTHTELSPAEVQKLLKALPVRTDERIIRGEKKLGGWPARAFFTVLYETTLRPETLWSIKVPGNYRKGSKSLIIDNEQDKARFGRRVPLSAKARKALDEVCPAVGQIFPRYTYRKVAKAAARAALSPEKAATFHPYDLRAAGGTHRLERGAPIPGVQWLFGHRSVATTARYIRASERSAEEAVSGRRKRSP
ncbi:MAG TPA: site-specific integrase, partial [Gemmatimonadales bacterium]|nr:site-specific integrase [Gemmatimonadales bacterium]